jgi:fructokinase
LGREILAQLTQIGLSPEFVQVDPEAPTGTVRVTVDADGQPSYEIADNVAWDRIQTGEQLLTLVRQARAICYGSLAQRHEQSRRAIDWIVSCGGHSEPGAALRVFDVNLRQHFFTGQILRQSQAQANWIKLNTAEAKQLAEAFDHSGEALIPFIKQLLPLHLSDRNAIIWTHGDRGCDIFTGQGDWHIPGVLAAVIDTVGAGDAFTAAMVCLRIEGRTYPEAAQFATHYAARVCEHRGGTPFIDRRDVEAAIPGFVS